MKTGIMHTGDVRKHSFTVQEEDIASFFGNVVHEVCATYTLAREIEYASRLFVLELKEAHEEGIGTELTIAHLSPAFPGELVTIVATLQKLTHEDVVCSYEAFAGERLVARGQTGQKVFPREKIRKHFQRIRGEDQ